MRELKFIHITKTAGSFITHIGKLHGIDWGLHHKEYRNYGVHKLLSEKPNSLKERYDWFMIVRNPYTRILSEYYSMGGGIGGSNITHTLQEFNMYLKQKISTRYYLYPRSYGHYVEQHRYIDPTLSIHIIRYESMYKELKDLFNTYNININLDNYVDLKINSKECQVSSPMFTTADFSPSLTRYINHIYCDDFTTFNYDQINTYDYII